MAALMKANQVVKELVKDVLVAVVDIKVEDVVVAVEDIKVEDVVVAMEDIKVYRRHVTADCNVNGESHQIYVTDCEHDWHIC